MAGRTQINLCMDPQKYNIILFSKLIGEQMNKTLRVLNVWADSSGLGVN